MGVPSYYSWYSGKTGSASAPPSDFSAVTGWGQVYPEVGAPVDSNPASVQIANFQTWVHLTTGGWVEVQDESTNSIGGAHYLADFSGNSSVPWSETKLPDGSVSVDAPQSGYNDHFWPGVRGTYAPGTIDGVYVQANMKTDDPNANLVANLGADWWRSSTATFLYQNGVFVNNPGVGASDWVKLTTNYQTLYFTSLSAQKLQADPPPPLASSSPVTTPTQPTTPTTPTTPNVAPSVTQASASPGTGTEHVGDTITLTLGFSEAVNVTGTPTLKLNDGGTATYVSGSGTSSLIFRTTVASTDTNTSALAVTAVNLPTGASIKDTSGLAANLAGAVKTFSGLQVSTTSTSTSTSTTPSTPVVTKPVLTIADNTLWVAGRGGTVDLGANVTTTDSNDRVTVNITGLPKYETITDKLDGQTFRGNNITLTAAQVDSGLVLHSYYRGGGHPVATLTLTANAKDPVTGAVTTAAPKTITVTDPRPAATTTTTSPQTTTVTNPPSSTSTSTVAATAPKPITVTDPAPAAPTTTASPANQGFALFSQIRDLVANSGVATSAPHPITVADPAPATGTSTASLASQSFALLNQYLAGNAGRVDPGQIVAAVSNGAGWVQDSFLTRPQH